MLSATLWIHHQAEPARRRHKPDAACDSGAGARKPPRIAFDPYGAWRRSEAEKAPEHCCGAAAHEAGKAQDLADTQQNSVGSRLGVFKQHRAGRCFRHGRSHAAAAGHRRHEIGGVERPAAHHRSHAAVAQHGASVGQRHDLF